jgi:hypothetical protein
MRVIMYQLADHGRSLPTQELQARLDGLDSYSELSRTIKERLNSA